MHILKHVNVLIKQHFNTVRDNCSNLFLDTTITLTVNVIISCITFDDI